MLLTVQRRQAPSFSVFTDQTTINGRAVAEGAHRSGDVAITAYNNTRSAVDLVMPTAYGDAVDVIRCVKGARLKSRAGV